MDEIKFSKLVVHCKKSPYDIYVGRPGKYGNPFSHLPNTLAKFKVETREEAILKFKEWIMQQPELLKDIRENLKGKILGCHCRPAFPCHGDIIAAIANGEEK